MQQYTHKNKLQIVNLKTVTAVRVWAAKNDLKELNTSKWLSLVDDTITKAVKANIDTLSFGIQFSTRVAVRTISTLKANISIYM